MPEQTAILTRSFQLTDADRKLLRGNAEERSLELSFSSEHPVRRCARDGDGNDYEYDEVLSHDDDDCDLRMLNNRAPLCDNHNLGRQIGVVDNASIGDSTAEGYKGKVGRAKVRFSRSAIAEPVFQDVIDNIRPHVSVGYKTRGLISRTRGANGVDVCRFKWAPYEISSVSAPEDPNVGFGRSRESDQPIVTQPKHMPEATAVEVENRARIEERTRSKKIQDATNQLCKDFSSGAEKFRSICAKAIEEGTTVADFNESALAAIPGVRALDPAKPGAATAEGLGMSRREQNEYSFVRAIQSVIERSKNNTISEPDGLEGEAHRAMLKVLNQGAGKGGAIPTSGFLVPPDIGINPGNGRLSRGFAQRYFAQRDLNVTQFGQGGAFVPTTLMTPVVEILRNMIVCIRMGVQSIAGLQGNVVIPRQTGAAAAYALPETALLTESTQAIDQIALVPHRVGVWSKYSKLLLLQSSIDVENFLRDDLMKVLGIKWDSLMLVGQGANSEPTGILNTPGVASITFGATTTWAKVISFESALAIGNALAGLCGYVTTPAVRGVWKALPKAGTTNQFPVFIWESKDKGQDDLFNDGEVNGYRAAATNQIPNNQVFYGHWADSIQGIWGGFDVVVDPYTLANNAQVKVTVNTFGDYVVRHAASFAVSSDSGAQ